MREIRRAIVTGGAGFLGSAVCRSLIDDGVDVIALDDLSTGSPDNLDFMRTAGGSEFIRYDITRPWPEFTEPVDLVMHLACPASPAYYRDHGVFTLRTCSEGTFLALETARIHRARFVLASTSEVYGDPNRHPQPEFYWGNVNPIGERSVYDEGKRYAEALTAAYVRDHRLDAGIARIFNTYGPHMQPDDGRLVSNFIIAALAGRPLSVHGDGAQTRSLCFVDDTAAGLLALARSDQPGPINIGNPDEHTVNDIARTIVETCASESQITHAEKMPDDPRRRCPDIHLARTLLDWSPQVPLSDGLRRTIDWFARHHSRL